MIQFLIGLFLGTVLGTGIMCLMQIQRYALKNKKNKD